MNAQKMHVGQVDFQDTAANHPQTNEFSLLPGFIGFHQDAQRIKREAHQVYAINHADLHDTAISSREGSSHEDIPAHMDKRYR